MSARKPTPKRRSHAVWAGGFDVYFTPLAGGYWQAKGRFRRGDLAASVFQAVGATKDEARDGLCAALAGQAVTEMHEAERAKACSKKLTLAALAGAKKGKR